ncbi:MAG TPA: diguanylate cyclase [bacterium]|nr:diguanylate cyclase [bacterium]
MKRRAPSDVFGASKGRPTGRDRLRVSLRARFTLVYVVCIVIACAVSAFLYRAVDLTATATSAVASVNQVIVAANSLIKAVLDAETNERGFLLTGNDTFIAPYTDGVSAFDRAAADLRKLPLVPQQVELLDQIQSLFVRWRAEVATSDIAARRAAPEGLDAASQATYATVLSLRAIARQYAGAPRADLLTQWGIQAAALRRGLNGMVALEPSSAGLTALQRAFTLADAAENLGDRPSAGHMMDIAASLDMTIGERMRAARAAEAAVRSPGSSDAGKVLIDQIRQAATAFTAVSSAQLQTHLAANHRAARQAKLVATGAPLALAFLLILALVVWSGVAASIRDVAEASTALAGGDFTRRVQAHGGDELGMMAQAYNSMAERMRAQVHETLALIRMSDLLQASVSIEEAYQIMGRTIPELFPRMSGAVYLTSPSGDVVESVASWGTMSAAAPVFNPNDCWALRRGQVFYFSNAHDVPCRHLPEPPPGASVCVPLVAQGDAMGVLFLVEDSVPSTLSEEAVRLARVIGDQIALAIANLRLRETLRDQSIRDALTGLYNRRYLEETLDREIRRAERTGQPLSVVMFDIDLLKHFNDTFGHDAGDLLLREIGSMLRSWSRQEDIACRYGGDEFVITLPGATLSDARRRAEEIVDASRHLDVRYRGNPVGSMTLSLGVATYPTHGATMESLIRAADAALYRAKQRGRARIEVAAG